MNCYQLKICTLQNHHLHLADLSNHYAPGYELGQIKPTSGSYKPETTMYFVSTEAMTECQPAHSVCVCVCVCVCVYN